MRRRWGLAFCLCVVIAPVLAFAQSAEVVETAPSSRDALPTPQAIGYAAMPGGLHAPSAETLTKGVVEVATYGGFGTRSKLLGADSKFSRGLGSLAVAFAPTKLLTVALSLDGYFDKHDDGSNQDGFVGNPNLILRVAKPVGNLRVGGQLGIWIPGGDAPSVKLGATTVDARALLSLKAGSGLLTFSGGFRLDNSFASVATPIQDLAPQDRVSLGVSEFNAALAGVQLALPLGAKAYLNVEGSLDYFIGEGETPMGATEAHAAPGAMFRFGGSAGYHITPQYSVFAFVQGSKVPSIPGADRLADDIRVIPYAPTIAGGLGFAARFGGPKRPAGSVTDNLVKQDIPLEEFANVSGEVYDDAGKPIIGAKVDVKLKSKTGTAVTDDKGVWKIEKLPIGKTVKGVTTLDDTAAEVSVSVDGKKPAKQTLTLAKGDNAIPRINLDPDLPPGEILGLVRSAGAGKPLAGATIKIEPGGFTATAGPDGNFSVAVPPGVYKATASAPGFKDQTLDAKVEANAPVLKNFELPK
ncbi:MAG: carboxypeptidase regulatory-like domain-containing protein [Kofleriaceae bacterium]|nr:carboxypeptidase regulatory-like domain-containing protein [Kofleriaceae bacterium]